MHDGIVIPSRCPQDANGGFACNSKLSYIDLAIFSYMSTLQCGWLDGEARVQAGGTGGMGVSHGGV